MSKIIKDHPVRVRQGNDDPWMLPECISWLESPPLWYAVSWYCLLQKRDICREEISEVFRISPRRAGDILGYIIRNCRKQVKTTHKIKCSRNITKVLFVHVYEIRDDCLSDKEGEKLMKLSPSEYARISMIRRREERARLSELGKAFLLGKCIKQGD